MARVGPQRHGGKKKIYIYICVCVCLCVCVCVCVCAFVGTIINNKQPDGVTSISSQ